MYWGFCLAGGVGFCFVEGVFLVSADGLGRVRFSRGRGEQRVLVAAPRFALYVARNKHPLLAFWFEWMVLVCQLLGFIFSLHALTKSLSVFFYLFFFYFPYLASASSAPLVFAHFPRSVFVWHSLPVSVPSYSKAN